MALGAILHSTFFLLHSHRGGLRVALGWLWGRNPLAINRLWGGFKMALGGFAGPSTFCILPSTFALLPFLHSSFCILPSTFTLGDLVAAGQPLHNARVLCHQGPQ